MLKFKSNDVYYNTKIKTYPDGSKLFQRCSKSIFKSSDFEELCTHQYEIDFNAMTERLETSASDRFYVISSEGTDLVYLTDKDKSKPEKKETTIIRDDSLKRARQNIYDLITSNDWDYFITLTLNKENGHSDPIKAFSKLSSWLYGLTKRYGFKYVLVAEYHKKGGIHAHAVTTKEGLKMADSGTRIVQGYSKPLKESTLKRKGLSSDKIVYNITNWKYGFSTAIQTYGNSATLANYVSKYITKDNRRIFGK